MVVKHSYHNTHRGVKFYRIEGREEMRDNFWIRVELCEGVQMEMWLKEQRHIPVRLTNDVELNGLITTSIQEH